MLPFSIKEMTILVPLNHISLILIIFGPYLQLQDILQTANFMRHELCVYGYVTAVAAATSAYCMYTLYMPAYLVRTKFIRFSLGKILC